MPKRRKKKKFTGKKVALDDLDVVLREKEIQEREKLKAELNEYKSGLPSHLWALVVGFAFYKQEIADLGAACKRCLENYPDAFSNKVIGRMAWRWKLPDRTIDGDYVGELSEDIGWGRQPDGWGTFSYNNEWSGHTWISNWKRRIYSYRGPWSEGKAEGDRGTWAHHGFHYEGSFFNGKRNGKGRLTKMYDGEVGSTYNGKWKQDMKHGEGEETRSNRRLLRKGRWEYDDFVYGTFQWPDGSQYVGHFKTILVGPFGSENNTRHGKGKLFDPDGRLIAEGFWDGGKQHSGKKYEYVTGARDLKKETNPVIYEGCLASHNGSFRGACIRTKLGVCTLGQWGPSGFEDFPSAHSDPFIYEETRYEELLRQYCTPSSRSSSLTPTSEGRYFS